MDSMDEILKSIVAQICSCCAPRKIIMYGEKRTLSTAELKSVSFCVIVPSEEEVKPLRGRLYLAIEADFPVSLTVYTIDEWNALTQDPVSYAAWICRRGRVLYESAS